MSSEREVEEPLLESLELGTNVNGMAQGTSAQDNGQPVAGSSGTGNAGDYSQARQGENVSVQPETRRAQYQNQANGGNSGSQNTEAIGNSSGGQTRSSELSNSQIPEFKKKVCINFFPSRSGFQDYKNTKYLDQDYSAENIRCRCGLCYKEHEKEGEYPKSYPIVQDLLEEKITAKNFEKKVYKEEKKNLLQKGYTWDYHDITEKDGAEMGDIEFQMDLIHSSKSRFARMSDSTNESIIKDFLKNHWKLLEPKPQLVISLIGTTQKKDLAEKLVESIIGISRFVNLIIFTSGLESDIVAKKIGDTVTKEQKWTTEDESTEPKAKIKCVGITTWGSLEDKPKRIRMDGGRVVYCIEKNQRIPGHYFLLNPGHKFFLLVDTGLKESLSTGLNETWNRILIELKKESIHVVPIILGKNSQATNTIEMTEKLLARFPAIFLHHSEKFLEELIERIIHFQGEESLDIKSLTESLGKGNGEVASAVRNFLKYQVQLDRQKKNVMVVCDFDFEKDKESAILANSLDSCILKVLAASVLVKARVNVEQPSNESVLQVMDLATTMRCWDRSMDELLPYHYEWKENEKQKLKEIFKRCLVWDQPRFVSIFCINLLSLDEFLTVDMLADLYSQDVMTDPLQVVFKRSKFSGLQNYTDKREVLKKIVQRMWLPDCYCLKDNNGALEHRTLEYPRKELLIWAVLSKKWALVDYILLKGIDMKGKKDNKLAWFLATAYLCKAVSSRQLDMEIKNEFKEKQRLYEEYGRRLLEKLTEQHGRHQLENQQLNGNSTKINYTHLSLEEPSAIWGGFCPADLALLGNFKTFVRSEGFHNFIVQRWKKKKEDAVFVFLCQPRVKFYFHWIAYMIMVIVFCATLVSRIQHSHWEHQIWWLVWIFSYIIGEVITRYRQQKNVCFCSAWQQLWLITRRKYLNLLLLFCFLIGGFVCTFFGSAQWGAMLYGLACLILILNIGADFLSSFYPFAPQISILKKALREIGIFCVLIILLVWSGAMIFSSILCLDDKFMNYSTNATENSIERSWANMGHVAWFLYLSLYGEYSFELDQTGEGHLSCVGDKNGIMWVSYILIGLHILVGNVLLMNLLVSVIGTKADDLKENLKYQWKNNWYKLTCHYEAQTELPPPFNLVVLLVQLVRYCIHRNDLDEPDAGQLSPSVTVENFQKYQKEALLSLSYKAGKTIQG